MKTRFKIKHILTILVFITFALLIFSFLTLQSNKNLKRNDYWRADNNSVLYSAEEVLLVITDLETGTRGFVVTMDSLFLEPYLKSVDSVIPKINHLAELTATDPLQQNHLRLLKHLGLSRIDMCKRVLSLSLQKGFSLPEMKTLLLNGKGIMDSIRNVIGSIKLQQNIILSENEAFNAYNKKHTNIYFVWLIVALAVLFITLICGSIYFAKLRNNEGDVMSQLNSELIVFSKQIDEVVKGIDDPIIALDKNLCISFHNNATLDTLAIESKTIMGKKFLDVFPMFNNNLGEARLVDIIQSGKKENIHIHDEFLDKWFDVNVYPTSDGLSILIKDISHKKVIENELSQVKQFLEETNKVAMIGGWSLDLKRDKLTWTSVTAQIHETPEDFEPTIEEAISFYKDIAGRHRMAKLLSNCISNSLPFDTELEIITAKGNTRWIRIKGHGEFADGKCLRVFGTFQNIDVQKKIEQILMKNEEQLVEDKQLLQTIIDSVPVNIYMKDLQSRKTLVNKSEIQFCGKANEDDILGKSDFDLLPYNNALISVEEDKDVFETGKSILDKETEHIATDGTVHHLLTSKTPYYNDKNEIVGLIGISYDITSVNLKK
jgi:PAS domain S-box-containing protein